MNSNCHDCNTDRISPSMTIVVLFVLTDVTTVPDGYRGKFGMCRETVVGGGGGWIIIISTNCNIVGSIYGCVGNGA